MERIPLVAFFIKPSKPCVIRGAQAALSSIFGAPNTPAAWQDVQTAVYTASPERASLTIDLSTALTEPIGFKLTSVAAARIVVSSTPLIEFFSIVLNKFITNTATAVPTSASPPINTGLAMGSLCVE